MKPKDYLTLHKRKIQWAVFLCDLLVPSILYFVARNNIVHLQNILISLITLLMIVSIIIN